MIGYQNSEDTQSRRDVKSAKIKHAGALSDAVAQELFDTVWKLERVENVGALTAPLPRGPLPGDVVCSEPRSDSEASASLRECFEIPIGG